MPGKVQAYVEMANETAASITQDAEAWIICSILVYMVPTEML